MNLPRDLPTLPTHDFDDENSNTSDNPTFESVVAAQQAAAASTG